MKKLIYLYIREFHEQQNLTSGSPMTLQDQSYSSLIAVSSISQAVGILGTLALSPVAIPSQFPWEMPR